MEYKEFLGKDVQLSALQSGFIDTEDYTTIHKNNIVVCHDVFIKCTHNDQTGFLLMKRLMSPAKDAYYPVGGRVLRGITAEESLRKKALDECSLKLSNIRYLTTGRTIFKEEPFGHGKGTDTINLIFIADGEGMLSLNHDHETPLIITKELYPTLRETLDPYVQTYLDYIDEKNLW
jgi:ADP-ribose pyrophosphatase YjhB (NUDIX family)